MHLNRRVIVAATRPKGTATTPTVTYAAQLEVLDIVGFADKV